jgi:predicted 3-demethylubiquinone-9 3-methyltransferase (glyoxalase superfamily)
VHAASQKIVPFFTFHGNAEEAMNFYAQALPGTAIESIVRFEDGERGDKGKVLLGTLSILGERVMFMDMEAALDLPPFSWATSFYFACASEAEFDAVFATLSEGGMVMMGPEPVLNLRKVAWVIDRFGITWQPAWE